MVSGGTGYGVSGGGTGTGRGVCESHLLAVITPGDRMDPLFEKFMNSFPPFSKMRLHSSGFISREEEGKEAYLETVDYFLFAPSRFENFDYVNKEYFKNRGKLFEIDRMNVELIFKGKRQWCESSTGTVDEMLENYERNCCTNPESFIKYKEISLDEACIKAEDSGDKGLAIETKESRAEFCRYSLLSKGRKLVKSISVFVRLTCVSSDYVIKEQYLGTCVGPLNDLRRLRLEKVVV